MRSGLPLVFLSLPFLVLTIFFCPGTSAQASKAFHYLADLETGGSAGAFSFTIPLEHMNEIQQPEDLRIVDGNQKEIPFVLVRGSLFRHHNTTGYAVPLNLSYRKGESQSFEFEIPPAITRFHRLSIELGNQNFDRTVTLLGKEKNQEEYQVIKEGMRIIQHYLPEQNTHFRHTTLDFPPQKFPQYKVVISLPPGEHPLAVSAVNFELIKEPDPKEEVKLRIEESVRKDLKEKVQWFWPSRGETKEKSYYLLIPPAPGIPLEEITFRLKGENFTREAQLFVLKNDDRPERIHCGLLFKYGEETQAPWSFYPVSGEKYLLVIDHGQNVPVPLESAHGGTLQMSVRFLVESGNSPVTLYFGVDPDRKTSPRYDLQEYLNRNPEKVFQALPAIKARENPAYEAPFVLEKKWPYFIYLVVGVFAVGLGLYLFSLLKREGAPPPS